MSPYDFRPVAWPRRGSVTRLYCNFASAHGTSVYAAQTTWPRQVQNRNWQIVVTGVDARYDRPTRTHIRTRCADEAYLGLGVWLQLEAPNLNLDTATWRDLVTFATKPRQQLPLGRREIPRRGGPKRLITQMVEPV